MAQNTRLTINIPTGTPFPHRCSFWFILGEGDEKIEIFPPGRFLVCFASLCITSIVGTGEVPWCSPRCASLPAAAGAPLLRYRSERTLLRVGLLRGVALPLSLGFVVPRRPKKDIDQTRRERCSRREGLRSSSDGAEAGWVFFSGTSRKAQRAPTWGVGSCSEFSYVFLGSNAQ